MNHLWTSQRARGLSIVEFLVGIAVGLLVVVGASKLFADYVVGNKQLMLETRVNQDLRAAADIVARDVRRAGYWNNALTGVWSTGSGSIVLNPHASGMGRVSSTATSVSYSYARDTDDTLDSNEYAGFRLWSVNGVNRLEMWDGGLPANPNWQAITDPGTVRITAFSVNPIAPALVNDLSSYCGCLSRLTCTLTSIAAAGAPTLTTPSFEIVLTGQAVNDPAVTRTVRETVRVRNPILSGACPP